MLTITEALAEVNLLKKKIQDKEQYSMAMIYRASHQQDPWIKEGGAPTCLAQEKQAIGDLRKRLIKIRSAISKKNLETLVEINGESKCIFDWLTWRREVYQEQKQYLTRLYNEASAVTKKAQNRPEVYKNAEGENVLVSYIKNIDEGPIKEELERIEEIFLKLDGQLSLKNATTVIDI